MNQIILPLHLLIPRGCYVILKNQTFNEKITYLGQVAHHNSSPFPASSRICLNNVLFEPFSLYLWQKKTAAKTK